MRGDGEHAGAVRGIQGRYRGGCDTGSGYDHDLCNDDTEHKYYGRLGGGYSSFYNGATVSLAEDAGLYATVTTSTGLYTDYYWVAGENCSISDSTLTITGSSGDTFTVYAYSQYDTSVYATYTGTIVDTPTVNSHTGLNLSASASYIWRGGSVYLYAMDNSGKYYDTGEVTWSVSNERSTTYFTIKNTTDGSGNPCGLLETTNTLYDYSWSKTLTITASATDSTGTVTASYSISIPRVYVQYCVGSSTGTYSSYGYVSMSDINVGSSIDVYYQVTGIVSPGTVAFTWDDSTFASNNVTVDSTNAKLTITRTSSDTWSDVTLTATASVGGTTVGECALYVVYPSKSGGSQSGNYTTTSYSSVSDIPIQSTGGWQYMSDGTTLFQVWSFTWSNNNVTCYILALKSGDSVKYYFYYDNYWSGTWAEMGDNTYPGYNVTLPDGQKGYIPFTVTDGWEKIHFSSISYQVTYEQMYSSYCYILVIKDSSSGNETTYYSWVSNMSSWNTSLW